MFFVDFEHVFVCWVFLEISIVFNESTQPIPLRKFHVENICSELWYPEGCVSTGFHTTFSAT